MNDEPNTTEWNIGDLVIHDADEKKERMLMRVTGKLNGKFITEYINRESAEKEYVNRGAVLHDPARFDIEVTQ